MLGGNPESSSPAGTSLLYAGEHFDTDSQNYYLRARWYDSLSGRFNRMDPYAGNNQDPQSLHKYLYAHCNPVMNIDPSGLSLASFSLATLKVFALSMVIGSVLYAGIGAATGAYFHIIQKQSFEGIWTSVGRGALYGAIIGAVLGGLAAISANALAIGLSVTFGINFYFTVRVLLDPNMRPETKAAAILFLILQGMLSFRAIIRGFSSSGTSGSGISGNSADIAASAKQAALGTKPGEAYIGYVEPSGKVGLIKASPSKGLYGHPDVVAKGLIPKGSNGFRLLTNNQGEIAVLVGKSSLNNLNSGYSLPPTVWNAIKSGLKSVLKQSSRKIGNV